MISILFIVLLFLFCAHDCIILILHDHYPEIVNYQFSFKDVDPDDEFEQIAFAELTADTLYGWIRDYFQATS